MSVAAPWWLAALALVPVLAFLTFRWLRQGRTGVSGARGGAFVGLRAAAVALLVAALCGIGLSRFTRRISLVVLVDQSSSVTAAQRADGLKAAEAVRGGLSRGDSVALVRFGAEAEMETLSPGDPILADAGGVRADATDIAGAIQLGLARAAGSGAPRLLLLTDGRQNRGSAAQAAAAARSLGARIFPVPLGAGDPAAGVEVAVQDVSAPSRVRQDEPHEVTVSVRSRSATRALVTLLRDAEPAATRALQLEAGENVVQFSGSFSDKGLHEWDALVQAPGDGVAQNNHGRRFVEVSGPPAVLYVSTPGRESPSLLSAFAAQGITAVRIEAAALPGTLAGYLPYDAVVLDNAPGYGISNEKMETIARYVRDAGGGLLMVGGESSFGAGGYYKTPIERILPVDMDVKSPVDLPRLSLVIMMDKSGSMGGAASIGEEKLDVVKSAALSAMESLNPFDTVGVLAFDADWEWAVKPTSAGESERIAQDLSTLSSGGGTIMYPALQEAARVLEESPSPLRHLIILSDGLTDAADFEGLVKGMARNRITVSTVAVGADADAVLLEDIARWGGGRTYATNDPRDVPRIFMTEASLAGQGLLMEKSFLPRQTSAAESLRGISVEGMPALKGFVLTYMKPGAEMDLSALYGAPLLASWRYGLGRTAAFTSDLRGRWSGAWLSWDQFPRFISQLARWVERPSDSGILHPAVTVSSGKASLTVDASDTLGEFVNGLDITAVVIAPGGTSSSFGVPQTGPGTYQSGFTAQEVGDYTVTLSAQSEDSRLAPVSVGVNVPYSEEYRMLGTDTALLSNLAAVTGGRVISSAQDSAAISEALRREQGAAGSGSDAWRPLLLASLLLFFADIAVRRLPAGILERVRAFLGARRGPHGISYDELAVMVKKARDEERTQLHRRITGMVRDGRVDPDLAAYLYIARLRSRKASEETKKE
jgi:uncharacterized membrane protein